MMQLCLGLDVMLFSYTSPTSQIKMLTTYLLLNFLYTSAKLLLTLTLK